MAQSAFFFTAGMVSMALKRRCFSAGSLMYDSSSRLYISAGATGSAPRRTARPDQSGAPEWMFSMAIWKP